MELKDFIQKLDKDINLLLKAVLLDIETCDFCSEYLADGEIDINLFKNYIDETVFLDLIQQSKGNERLLKFISALSMFLRAQDVSPKVFESLLKIKGKWRDSILVGLSHCDLSFYQKLKLCSLKKDEAVLLNLLGVMLRSDIFSEYDIDFLLQQNHDYYSLEQMKYYFCHTDETFALEKTAVLKRWFDLNKM